jgi:catalase (peroxidase I)
MRTLANCLLRPFMQAPVILRLAYHDAGTFSKLAGDGGLNASIQYELDRPENFGLKRGWNVITQVSATVGCALSYVSIGCSCHTIGSMNRYKEP